MAPYRPIIVLGMHRGGTSLLANVLNEAGVTAGPVHALMPGNIWNPRGYWEHVPLVELNERLLARLRCSWITPPASDDLVAQLATDGDLITNARSLVNAMGGAGVPWLWKDPRLCILLPFWRNVLDNPIFFISLRHPKSIAASLKKRSGLPESAALLLWQLYFCSVIRNLSTVSDTFVVEYEELVASPEKVCGHICGFLIRMGILSQEGSCQMGGMVATVRPDLSRMTPNGQGNKIKMDASQEALYAALSNAKYRSLNGINDPTSDIFPGWQEFLILFDTVRTLFIDYRRRIHDDP